METLSTPVLRQLYCWLLQKIMPLKSFYKASRSALSGRIWLTQAMLLVLTFVAIQDVAFAQEQLQHQFVGQQNQLVDAPPPATHQLEGASVFRVNPAPNPDVPADLLCSDLRIVFILDESNSINTLGAISQV